MTDGLPIRKAGRPRGAKNKATIKKEKDSLKYRSLNQTPLIVPLLPLVWRARKQLWLIRNIEEHLKKDPTYISPKEYFHLLKEQEAIYTELEKAGQGTNENRRKLRAGVRQKRLGSDGVEVATSRVGEVQPPSVGDGVSAVNPFRKEG